MASKIFKPRRGKKSTMAGTKKTTVLSAGEMFIEVPDTGAGTGHSKMKIGDGSTQYSSLPYAMGDTENDKIAFSNDTSGNITTALNKVTSGAALKTMIAALKQAVSLANTSITQLNDDLAEIENNVGKLSNLVIYTKLSDLGLPSRGVTVNQIYNAMDDYSMALIDVQNSEVITDGPGSSGLLEIYKVAAGRNFARCTISNSTGTDVAQIWYGVFTWAGDKKFQGWHRITDDKFFNWNSLPGKPSTFTPAGHTQDASTISGAFVNKDMRWYLGNGTDYAQIRQSGNTNNKYCTFIYHDTRQNKDTGYNIFDPNGNFLLATKYNIDDLKTSFQDGVDTLYNACVSAGQTPIDKSPSSIAEAIKAIKASGQNYYRLRVQNIDVNTDRSQANGWIYDAVRVIFDFSSTNTGHRTNGVLRITDETASNTDVYYKSGTGTITDYLLELDPTHVYKVNMWTGGGTGYNCTFDGTCYYS